MHAALCTLTMGCAGLVHVAVLRVCMWLCARLAWHRRAGPRGFASLVLARVVCGACAYGLASLVHVALSTLTVAVQDLCMWP